MTPPPDPRPCSHVVLVGRLGASIDRRALPSGDELTAFTVVVDRPAARGDGGRRRVDAIACQAARAAVMRRLDGLEPGTWVRVEGTLRRRFWRAGVAAASATVVEVSAIVRCRSERASMGA